ncbi:MAG: 5'/3'-nucleotidase SurE [Deltaproteobacteria bacterium]
MRVLLTNDDGFWSQGLRALEAALEPLCELWIVAPDREQSAASHAITLARPLRLHEVAARRFVVDGTPTDCVYLALNHLLKEQRPQVVFSGINHGANLADDVVYSGTVAGAIEGALLGVPFCAAFSLAGRPKDEFRAGADFARALLERVQATPPERPLLLNVNVPPEPSGSGFAITRLGRRGYGASVVEKTDPRGRKYYWIGGPEQVHQDIPGSDCNAVLDDRIISVTPLHLDLSSPEQLDALSSWTLPRHERR